jgi:Nuclear transport factor 2 (NTF2) domain
MVPKAKMENPVLVNKLVIFTPTSPFLAILVLILSVLLFNLFFFSSQEIHNRITSIGFEDCKVFIHSVDAQSSANGGIIIQVIGEMSNRREPWRKFVQTFFLAEQPNGYFVLNDIFRFLKEETMESDEERDDELPAHDAPASSDPSPSQPSVPIFEAPSEPELVEAPITTPSPAPPIEQSPINVVSEPIPVPQSNGIHTPAPPDPEPEPTPVIVEKSPAPAPAAALTSEPPAVSPVPTPSSPAVSASAPPSAPSPALSLQPLQPPPQPTPPPQSTAPSAPKTWANLAATNPKKWGSAVAQESRGTTEVPATNTPSNVSQSPASHGPAPGSAHRDHPIYAAAQSVTTPQCFVKVGLTYVHLIEILKSFAGCS